MRESGILRNGNDRIPKLRDELKIKGRIKVIKHDPEASGLLPRAFENYVRDYYDYIHSYILRYKKENKDCFEAINLLCGILDRALLGFQIYEKIYDNLTCTVGRTEIAKALGNNSPLGTYLEYCALGTGAGVPAVSDTQLSTELARKVISLLSQSGTQITARTFFTTSEGNGTLTEVGHFLDDATAAVNSGTIFNHATIAETKTSSMTLTIILTADIDDG